MTTEANKASTPISMRKGDRPVSLTKSDTVTFTCTWPAATDYDLYALVLYKDGSQEYVATFPAGRKKGGLRGLLSPEYDYPANMMSKDGAVRHGGDVGRGEGTGRETIQVTLNDRIQAVVPVAYSAQSNGTGSFRRYQVATEIVAGDQAVRVSATNASDHRNVYTLVPGILINRVDRCEVQALEYYSAPGSELRPTVSGAGDSVVVAMDSGPKNAYK